jgi:exosortase A
LVNLETKPAPLDPAQCVRSGTSGATAAAAPGPAIAAVAAGPSLAWRAAWIAFGVGFAAAVGAFWETASVTFNTWLGDTAYNHGILILPICGYLVWLHRDELARMVPRPSAWGFALAAVAGLGWLLGHAAGTVQVQQFGLLGVIWGLFLAIFGVAISKRLAFVLFYMVFAVPFGRFLVPYLQDFTAVFAVWWLEFVGIPVFSDGIFISVPNGNFHVAETCAGIRFLTATLALGFLFSYLTYRSNLRRAAFIALCVVVPIVGNGFRAFGIVLVGHLSNMEIAVGADHIIYGWVFFAFITVILLAIGHTFRDREIGAPAGAGEAVTSTPAVPAWPRIAAAGATALVLAAAWPAYSALVVDRVPTRAAAALSAPPVGNGWKVAAPDRDTWAPSFPAADATLMQRYTKDGATVRLFIAYYAYQRHDAEVINFANALHDVSGWLRVAGGGGGGVLDGVPIAVDATRIAARERGRLVWSWYWVGGRFTANPYVAKLFEARAKLLGGSLAAAQIAIAADFRDRPAEAAATLGDFMASLTGMRAHLERLGGS